MAAAVWKHFRRQSSDEVRVLQNQPPPDPTALADEDCEDRYRALADSSRDWIYLINPDGSIGYVSPVCSAMVGYPPDEFSRHPELLQTMIYPEDLPRVADHFPESIHSPIETSLEFRVLTRTGEVRWIQHFCRQIYTRRAVFVGLLVRNQDITAQKQYEYDHIQAEKRLNLLTHQLLTIQEAERRRISQDLHDDTGQGMTALLLRLNAIQSSLPSDQKETRDQLQEAIHIVESLVNQVRQLAYQLRPPSLDSVPLSKAVESLCSSFGPGAGLQIDYSSDQDLPPVPNLQETALYRLAQEGLNNAIKYARATTVWINLDYVDGEVSLSIEDNGRGFDLTAVKIGMGLLGLQERFQLLNGGLEIQSAPGMGTHLNGYLPLANHNL
jgi:PAS domain S-box-containing protein